MLKAIIAKNQNDAYGSPRAIIISFEDERKDPIEQVKRAVLHYCRTTNGLRKYNALGQHINWADFAKEVDRDICKACGVTLIGCITKPLNIPNNTDVIVRDINENLADPAVILGPTRRMPDNTSLELSGLTPTDCDILKNAGYHVISDLRGVTDNQLLLLPGVGPSRLDKIRDVMHMHGIEITRA